MNNRTRNGIVACTLCILCVVQGSGARGDDSERDREASTTFVTALYDIGRETWPTFRRSFSQYLERFKHLLAVDINLVIFGEKDLSPVVKKHRKNKSLTSRTRFVTKPFPELPAYRHKLRFECVFELESFREDNAKLAHPEAYSSDYLVLLQSKAALLGDVIRINPFNTTHFFWIDSGYAAVEADDVNSDVMVINIPPGQRWTPISLLSIWDKVTYVKLHDLRIYTDVDLLHKQRIAPALSGGFFGGAGEVTSYYIRLYRKRLFQELAEGEVAEDQTTALHVCLQHPRICHLVRGAGFFDAFRLFP